MQILSCGKYRLSLDRPLIMGVLNVTPDSFSDGGRFALLERALAQAAKMIEEGADIIDVGGESTRPGAAEVSVEEELARVVPVISALSKFPVPVSVDTKKPEVMREALRAGAAMVNDVNALVGEGLCAVRDSDAAVCLMHMQGNPQTMQRNPSYQNPTEEVRAFLAERAKACVEAGIARERIMIDPGFGFGKNLGQNLALLAGLSRIAELGFPVLAGLSRKSMLGEITGRAVRERLHASVAAALLAVERGAAAVRVHDVAATRDALLLWNALQQERK